MVKVVVAGAAGRMGREILRAVAEHPEMELQGGFERPDHPQLGVDLGSLAGGPELGLALAGSLAEAGAKAQVLIEFTYPEPTLAHLRDAAGMGLAAVVGTTGLGPEALEEVAGLAGRIAVVLAPNMSVGVNLLYKLASLAAAALGQDWDLEVVETHHRLKKDAPSGTAIKLAEALARARGVDLDQAGVFSRHGFIGERGRGEIGLQALRGGDIVGEHTILMAGPGERLELTHRAHSRANFAQGALRAAAWLVGRGPGLYDMQDVLGLK